MPLLPVPGSTVVLPSVPTTRVKSGTRLRTGTVLVTSSVKTPLQVTSLRPVTAQVPAIAVPLPERASMVAEMASAERTARVVGESLKLRDPRLLDAPAFFFRFIGDPSLRKDFYDACFLACR